MRLTLLMVFLFSLPVTAEVNFAQCADWINYSTELRDAGARSGPTGMIRFNADGTIEERRRSLFSAPITTENGLVYQGNALPELTAILGQSQNGRFRRDELLRDEVSIERDSSGRPTRLRIARAIDRGEMIRDTLVPAYQHIQDIRFAYDSAGCYPVSRETIRKVGELQEPDSSESFVFADCAEIVRVRESIGLETRTVNGESRPVLRLPELGQCRRLVSAVIQAQAPNRARREYLESLCSDSTYRNESLSRRDALDRDAGLGLRCGSLERFIPRPEAGPATPAANQNAGAAPL